MKASIRIARLMARRRFLMIAASSSRPGRQLSRPREKSAKLAQRGPDKRACPRSETRGTFVANATGSTLSDDPWPPLTVGGVREQRRVP